MENPVKNVYGYVRVSTRSQNYEQQVDNIKKYCAFKEFNLVNVFADTKSGKNVERDGFQSMVNVLDAKRNPQNITTIVATKLDRVGRSLMDLLKFSKWCFDHNINLVFTQSNIDTTTPENKMFFQLMAVMAEYEREHIIERTSEGRARYIAGGGVMGKPKLPVNMYEVKRMLLEGVPKTQIAKKMKITTFTLYRRLREDFELNNPTLVKKANPDDPTFT